MISSLSKKKEKGRKKGKKEKKGKGKEGKKKKEGKEKVKKKGEKEGNRKKEGKRWFLAHTGKLAKPFLGKNLNFSPGGKNIINFRDVNAFKYGPKCCTSLVSTFHF